MARFSFGRPSRFFRRNASAKTTSTTNSSTGTQTGSEHQSAYTDLGTGSGRTSSQGFASEASANSPGRPLHPPTPRKSASLTKLRERFLEKTTGIPESVQEARESLLVVGELESSVQAPPEVEVGLPPRRSGSETLAASLEDREGKSPGSGVCGSRRGSVEEAGGWPAEEVKLEKEDIVRAKAVPPALRVQEPTPDVPEEQSRQDLNPDFSPSRRNSREVDRRHSYEAASSRRLSRPLSQSSTTAQSVSPNTSVPNLAARQQRQQSIADSSHERIVRTLIDAPPKRREAEGDYLQSACSTALPTSVVPDYFTPGLPNIASIMTRKIWVRRPGQSATLVQIKEDDLVDDVRDMILKKYANSLGRTFDAPDMVLRIAPRVEVGQQRHERILGPEEEMCRTIDHQFPGGQTVDDALVIDVPQKRTPRPSPRAYPQPQHYAPYHAMEDYRPVETGTDYFPPMPAIVQPTLPQTSGSHDGRVERHPSQMQTYQTAGAVGPQGQQLDPQHQRSISVLNTGQIAPLPSPGGRRHHREHRPKFQRQHTSSPTIVSHAPSNSGAVAINPASAVPPNLNPVHPLVQRSSTRQRLDSSNSDGHMNHVPNGAPPPPPALPTPPAPEAPVAGPSASKGTGSTPPTPNQNRPTRPKKSRKPTPDSAGASGGRGQHRGSNSQTNGNGRQAANGALGPNSMLDGAVPPINVLIVEDNIINLRILEGLMKRLKVRWQTAMNGQIAVDKWKTGGFHLVLMDIQMPVMNGLAATKEIRRLERVNGIGVFSSPSLEHRKTQAEAITNGERPPLEEGEGTNNQPTPSASDNKDASDELKVAEGLFKSPVIIVALTASSLQSDRHEALAAGCNDFLTKPVNFVWLERKVKEWGCMQALIDFDGWRRWKDYSAQAEAGKSEEEKKKEKEQEEKQKVKMEKMTRLQEKQRARQEEENRKKDEEKRKKRESLQGSEAGSSKESQPANGEADDKKEDKAGESEEGGAKPNGEAE
ncbi:CheY-like protein [Hortaea werneckii]|nr:CheY-like protein [Hortaea werneckii]KAI7102118.1 CheY-like protein [Hortaea werneckii]KAI7228315.1 CheY-like protein [Hortaea werneckii]KAI7304739.1 CheY-like protein [Hortaea werneckii]KAI7399223.1 CheY-like protein [Hortaea werneckii]